MCKYVSFAAIAATLALGISGAHALTATGNLEVRARVTTACSVTANAPLDFGSILTTGTESTNTSTTISVTCGAPYKLVLGNGEYYDNISGKRRVHTTTGSDETAASYMGYVLKYQDGTVWDNSVTTDPAVPSVPVYGELDPPTEGQVQGDYSDTVAMTLTY